MSSSEKLYGKFRIKRGVIEVEFEGEHTEVQKRFDTVFEWIKRVPTNIETEIEERDKLKKGKKKGAIRKTGETKAIRERLLTLRGEGFFDQPKDSGEIRKQMQTRGWYHTSPILQATLLRHSKDLEIKRIEKVGKYKYVKT